MTAAVSAAVMLGTAAAVSAETVNVKPRYPVANNKCGTVVITSDIDRSTSVKIVQSTPEGDFLYYDTTIPAKAENSYSFTLEGNDDVTYNIMFGVAKYKNSSVQKTYNYSFKVRDTDNMTEENISGFAELLTLTGSDIEDMSVQLTNIKKNDKNILETSNTLSFPVSNILLGDVNFDGKIDFLDLVATSRRLNDKNALTPDQVAAGDMNGNGDIDFLDLVNIAKIMRSK